VSQIPFLTAPTSVVRAEVLLVVLTKSLDGASTFLVITHPETFESVPYTVHFVNSLGAVPGITVATAVGVLAILAAGEFGYRFCEGVRDVLGVESPPYPCIAQHVTYVLSSALFVAAFVWNMNLVV